MPVLRFSFEFQSNVKKKKKKGTGSLVSFKSCTCSSQMNSGTIYL